MRRRRGSVAVVVLLAVLLMGLLIAGLVRTGARDQDLSARRLETVQAFYAAEAGTNMAFREIIIGVDEDGDGVIGSISSDGNDANDPTFGTAAVHVDLEFSGPPIVLHSRGRAGTARREIESRHWY